MFYGVRVKGIEPALTESVLINSGIEDFSMPT